MDNNPTAEPTKIEKERFLKKIQQWRELGFEVDELEGLLENNFDEFLRRRHQILKEQVKLEKQMELDRIEKEESPLEKPLVYPELSEPIVDEQKEEELLLIGEPLPPEDELELEPDEEAIIEVGKPARERKSKVHRTREVATSEEPSPDLEATAERKESVEAEAESLEEEGMEPTELEQDLETAEEELDFEDEEAKEIREGQVEIAGGGAGKKIFAVVIIVIVVLAMYYLFWINPGGQEEPEKVKANFEFEAENNNYAPGSIITLDASASTGSNLKYNWVIDDDFKITMGSISSKILTGYFTATLNEEETKPVTLTVTGKDDEDTITKVVTLKPRSFKIDEERLGDHGDFKVNGYLDITNPDGITSFSLDKDTQITVNTVHLAFSTKDAKPMTLDFQDGNTIFDGFQQSHSVYTRTLDQALDLSGYVSVIAHVEEPIPNDYKIYPNIKGTMISNDISYTDYETHNILYGRATNDLEITINLDFGEYFNREYTFTSNDIIESYPDLQKDPRNLRLIDLSRDELELGDGDAISVGDIIYRWDAKKVEYFYEQPVIEVNLTVNSDTMLKNKLDQFYLAFWIAEGISQPVKTQLYSVYKDNGNTTTLNYVSSMTYFEVGDSEITSKNCDSSTPDGHFYARRPGHEYVPGSNWTYLAPTKDPSMNGSSSTSFDSFAQEQAIILAQGDQNFSDYRAEYPACYVVHGYCTATGDPGKNIEKGTLAWNLTFGYHDPDDKVNTIDGLNIVITKDSSVFSEYVRIDNPPLSQNEFEPLLSFAGSEDIFSNYDDEDFKTIIFSDNKIDFDNINYGIETNLQYPNLEITSIMFIEHSEYAYTATYNQKLSEDEQRMVTVALDAENGQLLYFSDHRDNGFSLF